MSVSVTNKFSEKEKRWCDKKLSMEIITNFEQLQTNESYLISLKPSLLSR